MLRIIVRTDDASMAANVGGSVETTFATFDVEAPEVETFLSAKINHGVKYSHRQVVGIEVLRRPDNTEGEP